MQVAASQVPLSPGKILQCLCLLCQWTDRCDRRAVVVVVVVVKVVVMVVVSVVVVVLVT